MAEPAGVHLAQHGTQLFVYNNIRTNQIIYSLTRSLNNHTSLKQLPFLGKKSVPSHLRKDLWQPLCLISFPRPSQGLVAYRRLREFRRLHETSYPLSLITQTEGPHKGQLHSTKKRGKILMDQKANSVADLAAVLLRAEEKLPKTAEEEPEIDPEKEAEERERMAEKREEAKKAWMEKVEARRRDRGLYVVPEKLLQLWEEREVNRQASREKSNEEMQRKKEEGPQLKIEAKAKRAEWIRRMQKAGKKSVMRKDPQPHEEPGVEGVKISWANLLDAEFAEQWPEAVVHDGLSRHRYTAAFPVMEEVVEVSGSGKKEGDVPMELLGLGGKPVTEMRA
ncbi:MAG: hypothetical protein L6R38_006475 [Xanthoria sp. 2 TBL-2021]|nr:MAG: hypothetical protein L6R38_006475 [Xanthoria sp. 2 TBL-2021]